MPKFNIPKAYRVKEETLLWDTLRNIQQTGCQKVGLLLDQKMHEMASAAGGGFAEYVKAYTALLNKYRTGEENFDAACVFYEKLGKIYIIPCITNVFQNAVWSFLDTVSNLEDYSYMEDDMPSFMTEDKWQSRRRLWESLLGTMGFSLEASNLSSFHLYSPIDRVDEIKTKFSTLEVVK